MEGMLTHDFKNFMATKLTSPWKSIVLSKSKTEDQKKLLYFKKRTKLGQNTVSRQTKPNIGILKFNLKNHSISNYKKNPENHMIFKRIRLRPFTHNNAAKSGIK